MLLLIRGDEELSLILHLTQHVSCAYCQLWGLQQRQEKEEAMFRLPCPAQ